MHVCMCACMHVCTGSTIITVFGVATGFATNYATLLVIRTCLGFGVVSARVCECVSVCVRLRECECECVSV
jgi:hypothetical protein